MTADDQMATAPRSRRRRKRIYAIIMVAAVLMMAIVGGYLYVMWLARVVERITA